MTFIVSMCLSLPIALLPQAVLRKLGFISRVRSQQMALSSGQFCARWLLRLIPFCKVETQCVINNNQRNMLIKQSNKQKQSKQSSSKKPSPQPSIWVCNHTSALDVFILMAKDKELRGKGKRPIKIVYVSTRKKGSSRSA